MKLAVVINVAPGPHALALAVKTQGLLIEHMGSRLHSIRMAVPRLFSAACAGALKDEPDILVVAGGPRTARRAAQIAHEKGLPILFLPALRRLSWTSKLWNALSLEEMIQALAREDIALVRLGVGSAGGPIFFGNAVCGVLPRLARLREDLAEAETFHEGWTAAKGMAGLFRHILRPEFEIRCDGTSRGQATALAVTANGFNGAVSRTQTVTRLQPFHCTAWRHRHALGHGVAAIRCAAGADRRLSADAERFDCTRLTLEGVGAFSLMLDQDPVSFKGPVELRYLPQAIKTFAFDPARQKRGAELIVPDHSVGRRHNR